MARRGAVLAYSQDEFAAVGMVNRDDNYTDPIDTECSSVLIAPRWALTAKHCFDDVDKNKTYSRKANEFDIFFSTLPTSSDGPERRISHTPAGEQSDRLEPGQDVQLFQGLTAHDDDTDLALVRLDWPVRWIEPRPVPTTPGECGSGWTGTVVGL
jgi:hypothetical protein